jgi:hypothetical protein
MTNVTKGKRRRNLKKLTNRRAQALRNNIFLSEQEKRKLSNKIETAENLLVLTLNDVASHHYDY